ncbi:MAG: DUF4019 domain-containing protein [Gammaproteobacteria bacterium]|nr:DUF4019 domain-containing protein [Gammaproteobacteria bacterium]
MLISLTLSADTDKTLANPAAIGWLTLVDDGDYPTAWETSGDLMRESLSADELGAAIRLARGQFGAVIERDQVAAEPFTDLPDAPPGDYLVFSFLTSFAQQALANETLTLQRQGSDWLVVGYYIR